MNDEPESHFDTVIYKGVTIAWIIFLALMYFSGTAKERDAVLFSFILSLPIVLYNLSLIQRIWVERFNQLIFILMCVGGPIFAFVIVGEFFGWW